MIRENVVNNYYIFGVGTLKYLRVPLRCPNSKYPIGIFTFYMYFKISNASLVVYRVAKGYTRPHSQIVVLELD